MVYDSPMKIFSWVHSWVFHNYHQGFIVYPPVGLSACVSGTNKYSVAALITTAGTAGCTFSRTIRHHIPLSLRHKCFIGDVRKPQLHLGFSHI